MKFQYLIEKKLKECVQNIKSKVMQCTGLTCKNHWTDEDGEEFSNNHSEVYTMFLNIYHQLRTRGYAGIGRGLCPGSLCITNTLRTIIDETRQI